ncbi:MAG TPA: ABC transporter ATP-binding protein [Candidatus Methylomirabilis sp.]
MLEVAGLDVAYGDLRVLWDVTFSVQRGELVALVGPNGAGKTTALRAIFGLVPVLAGAVAFQGAPLLAEPPHTRIRHGLSLVPEGRRFFPHMSVEENLELGCFAQGARDGLRRELDRIYAVFPPLADRRRQAAGNLSGGQQQMLAIGMGLISHPVLLALDEPSLGLAPMVVDHLYEVVAGLKREGITVLLVEQQIYAALELADRAYILETGRIRREGPGGALLADPYIRSTYLGVSPVAPPPG